MRISDWSSDVCSSDLRTLWRCLSGRKISGWKFSRQMPVGPYFADFLCREAQLVIDLDGYSHDMRQAYDERRDHWLAENGYRVLRFTRSEERRVGKECVSPCSSRWAP